MSVPVRRTIKKKVDHNWREESVLDAIESQYADRSKHVFVRHVTDATGVMHNRIADAIVIGCWPSVGINLEGYEAKISRSDWLKEIQDLSKAAAFSKFCHYWWIAAPDGVVSLEEMPVHWGLKVVFKTEDGFSIRVKKAATLNPTPELNYGFFASFVRNARRSDPVANEIEGIKKKAYEEGYSEGQKDNRQQWHIKRLETEVEELKKDISEFQEASGIQINRWGANPIKMGEAVKCLLRFDQFGIEHLESLIHRSVEFQKSAEEILKTARELANRIEPKDIATE